MGKRLYRLELDEAPKCPLCGKPTTRYQRAHTYTYNEVYVTTHFRCEDCHVKIRVQVPYDSATQKDEIL